MPVDFQNLQQQVRKWGETAPLREKDFREKREQSLDIMRRQAGELELLRQRVRQAAGHNPSLRCAIPAVENLDAHFPLPPLPMDGVILAADGSQINPDRHAVVQFCVINVGVFEFRPGQSAPREIIRSRLLAEEELYTANGLITEEVVALTRDLNERTVLADLASRAASPVTTLTDGPLELFTDRGSRDTPEFQRLFQEYLDVLTRLSALGVITAGYVDKPRGDLVVRLLELEELKEDLRRAGRVRPFHGVTDAHLFRDLLAPGERSAVFGIQSSSADHFRGELALHFFYLNVGRPEHPWITRTEIPAWVAERPALIDRLQAVLVGQARIMGARPYPYALARAHEVAVVSLAEKEQLEQMMVAEMYRRGIPVGEKSNKQSHKDLEGRTRLTR
ncbi:MAG TPA: DNA double-strand break repair nuclease NurA [Anaerolineaceae bacterium]|nr:DNA double-strand break repair nuclease NurA [Anaerolineaceae bacterium]